MKKKVILDVDTGSDDAIAIMLALLSPEIEVQAICTCSGNVDIGHTTDNTLRLLWRMGRNVPVYKGLPAPVVKRLYNERFVTKKLEAVIDGKIVKMHDDQLDLPDSGFKEQAIPAVFYYKEALTNAEEPVNIITTGSLSNLATVLSLWPELAGRIGSLTIMGGGYRIYNNNYGEGNFWNDPEAAQIVLNSGIVSTIVPLDATHQAIITSDEIEVLRSQGNFCSVFAAGLLEKRMKLHTVNQPLHLPDSATMHDVVAVAAFLDPEILLDVRDVRCVIGFTGSAEGHCAFDRRESREKPNCRFAMSADRERFVKRFIETFAGAKDIR
jgi:inosine-uridine nucleoside N-ribohydrolase